MVDDDGDGDCGGSDGDYDTVYDAGCGDMAVMTMKTMQRVPISALDSSMFAQLDVVTTCQDKHNQDQEEHNQDREEYNQDQEEYDQSQE